jgi:hypothetical protein
MNNGIVNLCSQADKNDSPEHWKDKFLCLEVKVESVIFHNSAMVGGLPPVVPSWFRCNGDCVTSQAPNGIVMNQLIGNGSQMMTQLPNGQFVPVQQQPQQQQQAMVLVPGPNGTMLLPPNNPPPMPAPQVVFTSNAPNQNQFNSNLLTNFQAPSHQTFQQPQQTFQQMQQNVFN